MANKTLDELQTIKAKMAMSLKIYWSQSEPITLPFWDLSDTSLVPKSERTLRHYTMTRKQSLLISL